MTSDNGELFTNISGNYVSDFANLHEVSSKFLKDTKNRKAGIKGGVNNNEHLFLKIDIHVQR